MVEQSISIPEDKMSHVIGRGGTSLRQLESDHGVHIDAERTGGSNIRVSGSAEAVQAAVAAIQGIVSISNQEFPLSADKIACLTMNAAALVQELQAAHAVRIDVSRAKLCCKVTGLAEAVAAAKKAIVAVPSSSAVVPIQQQYLPFLLARAAQLFAKWLKSTTCR